MTPAHLKMSDERSDVFRTILWVNAKPRVAILSRNWHRLQDGLEWNLQGYSITLVGEGMPVTLPEGVKWQERTGLETDLKYMGIRDRHT